MGIVVPKTQLPKVPTEGAGSDGGSGESPLLIDDTDAIYHQVRDLLADGYGGVILRGPPGTSKSWYAAQIARLLTQDDGDRIRFVQFHPSYQYEDFVEGFVPNADGQGFTLEPKHLLQVCEDAADSDLLHVLVVDEVSRVDPARVFGEALTYIESSHRDEAFLLASGTPMAIPANVVIIGTMNVFDRGVDQVDAALERRLAYIPMDPDADLLAVILQKNGVAPELQDAIREFFHRLIRHPNPYCRIGHAYFDAVRDLASLRRLWRHQLRFVFERAFPAGDDQGVAEIERQWQRMIDRGAAVPAEEVGDESEIGEEGGGGVEVAAPRTREDAPIPEG